MSTQFLYEKILLGLPVPSGIPVAVHWTVTRKLRKVHGNVVEFNYFQVMLPQLLTSTKYIAVINSRMLDLEDPANSDRATVINLAKFFANNIYIVWDSKNLWEDSLGIPSNLIVRHDKCSNELYEFILMMVLRQKSALKFH